MKMISHPFEPVFDVDCRILILGTFPSVKSRETDFYYGHPQNRFWKVLSHLYDTPVPVSIDEKKSLLLNNHIALWDVIASCEIINSSDSSIKEVVPNDIESLIKKTKITRIFCNGTKAFELYNKYIYQKQVEIEAVKLPSTSPANAVWTFVKLLSEWEKIRK